jgi:capsular exopolysaccharide synthesis family protein
MFDTQEMSGAVPGDMSLSQQAAPFQQGPQSVHLLDRLNAVFKHRRLAGAAFALVVAVMMIQTYSTVPMYQTSARIQIEDEKVTNFSNLNPNAPTLFASDPTEYRKTQYSILRSRGLAKRVVDSMGLNSRSSVFNEDARPRDPISLLREARASASAWVRSLFTKPAPQAPPQPMPDEDVEESAAISAFLRGVDVSPESDTRLVQVIYRHSNPQFAAQAANAIADQFTKQNIEQRAQATEKVIAWVQNEVKKQELQLQDLQGQMATYREKNNALSLDNKQNVVGARLAQLNDAVTKARIGREQAQAHYEQIKTADPKRDAADAFPAIGLDQRVVTARTALNSAISTRDALLARGFGPEYLGVIKAKQDVTNAQEALVAARGAVIDSARNAYQAAVLEERQISSSYEEAKSGQQDLERKSVQYGTLQRQADTTQNTLNTLLTQEKELGVVANSKENNVTIIDRAEIPKFPYAPNPRKEWLSAIMAGIVVAFGLAFGIEYLDDTVKTPEDVTRRLRLPLLGLVPAIRGDRVPVLTDAVPHDFGEAFRSLRTSLVFTSGSEHTRIVAVTSSQPLEGKTTTAANLALALALGGSRVLLIDADMRRPGLHKTLGMENSSGLSHLLTGQARVRDAIQRTPEPNLLVITAGRTPPNPSELLASERMTSFLANLQTGPFDWVVIDTPPVLAVTDAVILAPRVSGVVFVIGSEMTRRVHSERALETLRTSRPRGVTGVLNRVDFDRNKYYYSRYYGYQYKSYYGQNQAKGVA